MQTFKKKSGNLILLKVKETLTKLRNSNKVTVATGGFNYNILKHEILSVNSLLSMNFYTYCTPIFSNPVSWNLKLITDQVLLTTFLLILKYNR